MLKHMTVIGRLMNIIEFLNNDGLKLRSLWSVRTRMLPATRRKLISRTHEKRMSPAPVIPGRGGRGRLVRRGCGAPGYPGAGFGRVQFSSIYQPCIVCVSGNLLRGMHQDSRQCLAEGRSKIT